MGINLVRSDHSQLQDQTLTPSPANESTAPQNWAPSNPKKRIENLVEYFFSLNSWVLHEGPHSEPGYPGASLLLQEIPEILLKIPEIELKLLLEHAVIRKESWLIREILHHMANSSYAGARGTSLIQRAFEIAIETGAATSVKVLYRSASNEGQTEDWCAWPLILNVLLQTARSNHQGSAKVLSTLLEGGLNLTPGPYSSAFGVGNRTAALLAAVFQSDHAVIVAKKISSLLQASKEALSLRASYLAAFCRAFANSTSALEDELQPLTLAECIALEGQDIHKALHNLIHQGQWPSHQIVSLLLVKINNPVKRQLLAHATHLDCLTLKANHISEALSKLIQNRQWPNDKLIAVLFSELKRAGIGLNYDDSLFTCFRELSAAQLVALLAQLADCGIQVTNQEQEETAVVLAGKISKLVESVNISAELPAQIAAILESMHQIHIILDQDRIRDILLQVGWLREIWNTVHLESKIQPTINTGALSSEDISDLKRRMLGAFLEGAALHGVDLSTIFDESE